MYKYELGAINIQILFLSCYRCVFYGHKVYIHCIVFNSQVYLYAWGGFSAGYEDREEDGKAKGKEGTHGAWGEARGARCKTKEAWPRH